MDIYCPVCGEPWDSDELHYEAEEAGKSFEALYKKFKKVGCAVFGTAHADSEADPRIKATYDLLGDDVDGAASLFEDLEM